MRGVPRWQAARTEVVLAHRPSRIGPASRAEPREAGRCAPREAAQPLPASRRPSVHPDFRNRVIAAEKLRPELDRLLASLRQLEAEPRAADLRIRMGDDIAHFRLVERDRALDLGGRNAFEVFTGEIDHDEACLIGAGTDAGR